MPWYAAHVVLKVEFKDGREGALPAWENIYLIQASDAELAESRAELFGKANEGDSNGTFTWNDRPARWVLAGVRKVVDISNTGSLNNDIGDGAEVSYQTLEFADQADLDRFMEGEPIQVRIVD